MGALLRRIRRLRRNEEGAVAIEYAFVLPVLLVVSMAALDGSLLMHEMHNGTEATRRGAREALLQQQTLVDEASVVGATIACTYDGSTVTCSGGTVKADADDIFDDILAVMQTALPKLKVENVTVTYRDTGLSNGAVVTPTVTVSIDGFTYNLIVGHLWTITAEGVELPSFRTVRVMSPNF